ncbi:hypothetical protein DEO23_02780 [Brachybacterium endophyticum]|uniref:Uncharacterized protein n=1 Tax=Brachybacterium endophyticum TaxID=2182385 RepID=A0A2U2RP12_9MICO|nr:hypothetical protein [Brachybacterium endophyticum]PWH07571.1 hypothetical protein DEO23_02780 [Brachybacterium endophyticum]
MTTNHSTHGITRGAFLRSTVALTGGALGVGSLATSAHATPVGRAAETGSTVAAPPASWKGTVFTEPVPGNSWGYLDNYSTLYEDGPITSLSPEQLVETEAVAGFMPEGSDGHEMFTGHAEAVAELDGEPVGVVLTGDQGTKVQAEARLTKTANSDARGVLLHILTPDWETISLPKGTPIVEFRAAVDSPSQITAEDASHLLADAVGFSFQTNGDNPARVTNLRRSDGNQHISGTVSYPVDGALEEHTWFGTAVPGYEGWAYIFGQLPE